MSSVAVLRLTGVLFLASGCAEVQPQPTALQHVSASTLMIEPNKYNGKLVAAIGVLKVNQYLYLDISSEPGLKSKAVYVQPRLPDEETYESWLQSTGCEEALVRVYGRFHRWSSNEAWIDHVYLITTAVRRAPGPEDRTCWANSDLAPR